ncbi:MAG TPA: hypothetical protein VK738_20590 [Terriglobales bacterium]|nr:hypothetical protein [Terriglobales bacterium]
MKQRRNGRQRYTLNVAVTFVDEVILWTVSSAKPPTQTAVVSAVSVEQNLGTHWMKPCVSEASVTATRSRWKSLSPSLSG